MTPDPSPRADAATAAPSRRASSDTGSAVTVVVVLRDAGDHARRVETVEAVLAQRPASDPGGDRSLVDTVLLVDATAEGITDLAPLEESVRAAGVTALTTRLPERGSLRRALPTLVESLPEHPGRRELVWVLTDRTRPEPAALSHLVAAMGRGVAAATPKLVDRADRGTFVGLGIQATAAGRLVPTPRAGERDQGQHDDTVDVLAGPLDGLLLDREAYLALAGHDPRPGDLGGDLDLGWRAQRAGRRIVAAPAARVAVTPTASELRPSAADRAQARRVALARGPGWAYPFRALGGALLSLVLALGLALLRRPGLAADELAVARGSLDPRTIASLRRRGERPTLGRDEVSTLFVPSAGARSRLVDDIQGGGHGPRRPEDAGDAAGAGPGPLPWLLLAATALSAWAGREIAGELRHRPDAGLVGGELLGGRATAHSLLAAWRDAWHGQGVGSTTEQSPALLLLAGASWVVEHVPGGSDAASPAGVVLALLVLTALPLAAVVAYHAARVVTPHRWVRALLALGWVSTPVAAAAVGEGRIGPLLALVLLPRIAAGLVRAARPGPGSSDAVRTALWAAVLGSVLPVAAVVVVVVGLVLLLVGPSGRRGRGIALALVPPLLAGPWLLTLRAEPRRLLGGWGATRAGESPDAWHLAGAAPGGPGEIPLWWYLPVLALALVGLVLARGGRPWGAAATVVLGAAAAVGSPFVALGTVPDGLPDAGLSSHPWPGVGGLLVALGVLTLAGLGLDHLWARRAATAAPAAPVSPAGSASSATSATAMTVTGARSTTSTGSSAAGAPRRERTARAARLLALGVLAVGVVAPAVLVAQAGFGDGLTTWRDPRPQIAVVGAEGSRASRTLAIAREDGRLTYALVGREAPQLVRDVPGRTSEEGLGDPVATLLGVGPTEDVDPVTTLGSWGVGYVTVRDPSTDDEVALDAATGLRRMSTSAGTTTWSVRPEATGGTTPSRVHVVRGGEQTPVEGVVDHSATRRAVPVEGADEVVVGEAIPWTEHAVVTGDGTPLVVDTRRSIPTYAVPAGVSEVEIDVLTGHPAWRWVMLAALVVALYLALPTERRSDPEDLG